MQMLAPLEENYPQQSTQYQIEHVVETTNVPYLQPIMQVCLLFVCLLACVVCVLMC